MVEMQTNRVAMVVVVVVAAVPLTQLMQVCTLEEVECKAKAIMVLQAEVNRLVGSVQHLLHMVVAVVVLVVGLAMVLLWLVVRLVVVPGVAMVVVVRKATLMAQYPRMRGEEEEGVRVVITPTLNL